MLNILTRESAELSGRLLLTRVAVFSLKLVLSLHVAISCNGSLLAADASWILAPPTPGDWFDASHWSTPTAPTSSDRAVIDNDGIALISAGTVDVMEIVLAETMAGTLSISGGSVTTDLFDVGALGVLDVTGGTITVDSQLVLLGTLDVTSGSSDFFASDNSFVDISQSNLLGAGTMSFTGGVGSTLLLPVGVDPFTFFDSFSTQGDVFNVGGSVLIVPSGFTLDIASDRPDKIRVEGTLRPEGSPASAQSLTFDQGGVEVASGGLFNMFNRNLTLRTDSSVIGGELRDVAQFTIADQTGDDVTFTQTSGMTDVNSNVLIGYASRDSNPHGTFNMDGGSLSINGSMTLGTGNNKTYYNYFSEGTFRQTAGSTTVGGAVYLANRHFTKGFLELLGGTFDVGGDLTIATYNSGEGTLVIDGGLLTVAGNMTVASGTSQGSITLSGGGLDVANDVTLGRSDGQGTMQFTQSDGDFSLDAITVHTGSQYDLTGGTLTIDDRFDLTGILDFGGGNATVTLANNGIVEWSTGTLAGSAANTNYSAGTNSESYFPTEFDPNVEFASFSSLGLVHTQGTTLVVPVGFTMDIAGDRPDLTSVEGTLRPEGSPVSAQSLTFDQGGVEVAPGGLFNMYNRNLTLRTDSSVIGGELRDVATFTIADQTGDDVTFTQTSGMTDVNSNVLIGYASRDSNPHGTFNMDGGSLSINGSMTLGTGNNKTYYNYFSEGTFRQTAGSTTVGGAVYLANRHFTKGFLELLGGTFDVGGDLTIATYNSGEGTLVIDGGLLTVAGNMTVASGTSQGSITLSGGGLDVANDVTLGRSDGQGTMQFTQSDGDFSLDAITVHTGSQYDLTGGTLTIDDRFDLTGILDFGGGNATVTLANNGIVEWSTGTLAGSAANTNYSAGTNSESYFPTEFDPNVEFASFSSLGLVHTQGTTLVVPVGFTMDIAGDRPDLTSVEGTLRPEGSPVSAQSLTFDQGGVEVAPGGLFNMYNRNLTLRTDSSVIGGELRDVATFTIADQTGDDVTFTQTSGMTDVNSNVLIGYASRDSNPHGTFNMDGGSLSINGSMTLGTGNNKTYYNYFSEGTFRQTAGSTTVGGAVYLANRHFTKGFLELLGGTFDVGGDLTIATYNSGEGTLVIDGGLLTVAGNMTVASGTSQGSITLSGGGLDVANDVTLGRSDGQGTMQFTQSDGDFSLDAITVHTGSQYDLTGGTLTIDDRFDLTGILDFGGGNATVTLANNGIVEWSTGTLAGSAANTNYSAGTNSESYFPTEFDPNVEFASFSSLGLVHTQGTTLVVPVGFTMDIAGDRPDLTSVEGTLRPEGSPVSAQSLTFDQGGVEVAPGGLFNMYNRNLTLRTDSSVIGGELRDVATFTIADQTGDDVTFTQTSGMTDVNSNVLIGYASRDSNPHGTFNMDGGSLSINGSMTLGTGNNKTYYNYFSEGTFRQTAGSTTVGGAVYLANRHFTKGFLELLGGTFDVGGDLTIATYNSGEGTLVIDGGLLTVAGNMTVASGTSQGSITLSGGGLDVANDVTLGRSDGQGTMQFTQSDGDFSLDAITVHTGSQYDLTGGTLTIDDRFDLTGILDFGGGNATVTLANNGIVEWSTGTLAGSAANTNYSAGTNSESYFPTEFDPNVEFASFSSLGLVHTQGTTLVVPVGFTMDIAGDRPDLTSVEGTLRPEGSPVSAQSLTFDQGGVEVAPGGLFNMYNRNLTLRTDSSVIGGELRDVATFTIADQTGDDVTFTQTSGMTDVNSNVLIGYASRDSNPHGTFNMDGGSLSINGSMTLGTGNNKTYYNYFSEGTFRQTAGSTTVGGAVYLANRHFTKGFLELLGGTFDVGGDLTIATYNSGEGTLVIDGGLLTVAGNMTVASGTSQGSITLSGGGLDVANDVTLGRSDGQGTMQFTQSDGDFSLDAITVHTGSQYDLTGGTLTIDDRFDLTGILDFGGGNATVTLANNGIVEWSTGTLAGSAANTNYSAGTNSESYFPTEFDPNVEFASFSSLGLVHTQGTTLVVPVGFTMDIAGDRPDLTSVEGTLRPEGSPVSAQSLTFDQGGVEVAPGGLFNMYNRNLTLRTDSSVIGGELRDVATFTIADQTGDDVTFTQTSGMTDVNSNVLIGYASRDSNPHGTFNMDGGSLSINGSMTLGTGNNKTYYNYFSEGTFRQTAGSTTVGGAVYLANRHFTKGFLELLGGTFDVGGDLTIATYNSGEGTLVIDGGLLTVAGNMTVASGTSQGSITLSGGGLDVANDVTLGRSDGQGTMQFTQSDGDFSLDAITVHTGSQYDLTGGTLTIDDRFDLTGILDFGGGNATVTLANNGIVEWSTGTLAGSAANTNYSAGTNSESYFPTGFNPFTEFGSFSSQGLIHSTGTGIQIPVGYSGRIFTLIAADLFVSGNVVLEPNGSISSNSFALTGGTLSGGGSVNANSFINGGTISPGESIDSFVINSPYEQTAGGKIEIEIGGLLAGSSFDELVIDGLATLDGELIVSLFDGGGGLFVPNTGDEFTILTATGGIENQFADVIFPNFANEMFLDWGVEYNSNDVTLRVLDVFASADFNLDETVDGNDLTTWSGNFGQTSLVDHSSGDADGDGRVSGLDFLALQRQLVENVIPDADFDGNGDVDNDDLTAWVSAYGVNDLADADGDDDSDGMDFLVWQRQLNIGTSIAGDFNGDNSVNGQDFLAWQQGFGSSFNATDLAAWESNLGFSGVPLAAGVAAVPEPSCLAIVISAILYFATKRQQGFLRRQ